MHTATCPKCGRVISKGAPKGLCAVCLISAIFQVAEEFSEMPAPAGVFERVGGYELLEEIGRGGMGVVFRARDLRLNRIVALKLILTGKLASDVEVKRFRMEAEAAAQLDHPNIVPIYQVGESEGRHFFSMKLMEGALKRGTRNAQCGLVVQALACPLATEKIFAKLARAVHYAHERGILHRDIKPANILMDSNGEPAITDFGLARRLEAANDITLSGTIVGSPSYMAPEQAAGREITTAADTYSLGAVLFHWLTGRPPFAEESAIATMRALSENEPPAPSTLNRSVDRDLETICLKCLEKAPARRYPSAAALADDLERLERGEPIVARPVGRAERLYKWARRRPAAAALVLVSSVALLGGVILQLANDATLRRERDLARAQERLTRQNLYAADMFLAHRAIEDGNVALARRTLQAHRPAPGQEDLRGFEWRYLWQQTRGEQQHILSGFSNAVNHVAFSPDGRWLAAAGGHLVHCWNATNQQLAATLVHDSNSVVRSICFSPDGDTLWAGDSQGRVFRWEVGRSVPAEPPREPTSVITCGTGLVHVAAPAGADGALAIGERDRADGKSQGTVSILSESARGLAHSKTLREISSIESSEGFGVRQSSGALHRLTNSGGLAAFSRDGTVLLTAGGQDPMLIWKFEGGRADPKEILPGGREVSAIALSLDGRMAAACPYNSFGLVLIDFTAAKHIWIHREGVGSLGIPAFSPDGRTLALSCADHTVRLWDMAAGKETRRLVGHMAEVLAVAFSPDGQTLASCGKDNTVRLWSLGSAGDPHVLTAAFYPYAFSTDGGTFIAADTDNSELRTFRQYDVAAGRLVRPGLPAEPPPAIYEPTTELPFALPVGRAPAAPKRPREGGSSRAIALSPNRQILATGNEDSTIHLWDVASRSLTATLPGHHVAVTHLAFSPDGRTLVSSSSQTLKLWHVATHREVATLTRYGPTDRPVFSPDGTTLATSHWLGTVRLWRAPAGED